MSYKVSIAESINDILRTVKGDRVMRPEYGSELYKLTDRKVDDEYIADLTQFIVSALKIEPRVKVQSVKTKLTQNKIKIDIETDVVTIPYEVQL